MFSFGSLQATVKAVPESLCFVLDAFFDLGRGLFPLVQKILHQNLAAFRQIGCCFSGVCAQAHWSMPRFSAKHDELSCAACGPLFPVQNDSSCNCLW